MFTWSKMRILFESELPRQRERQQEADRRRAQGRPPASAQSAQPTADILGPRMNQDDDLLKARVATLETLLEETNRQVSEKQRWIDIFHVSQYKLGVKIGEQERGNKRHQEENATLRQEFI